MSRLSRCLAVFVFTLSIQPALAQENTANPDDVKSIENIVNATYASIERAPGSDYDWDRFRSLFLPEATLISNTEQRGGQFAVLSVEGFVDWISTYTVIGGENDKGFAEEGYHLQVDRYGDIANAMSTYQKHFYGDDQILGRGINSFQLVWHDNRWWIVSIIWDEETGAGAIPEMYGGN